jgi:hypothetical protein
MGSRSARVSRGARGGGSVPRRIPSLIEAESLALRRGLGNKQGIAASLNNPGLTAQEVGDSDKARTLHEESLGLRRELRETTGSAASLIGLAAVMVWRTKGALEQRPAEDQEGRGQIGRAATLLGAATTLLESTPSVLRIDDRQLYEQNLALVRSLLNEAVFAKAWATGRAVSLEEVTSNVLKEDVSG